MMLIYAHRGASAIHPENTLRAFRHALAIGVDGIELDVHATGDGVPIAIHDRDVGRTTDGTGHVDEIPLTRLETFDAGEGERVPTLAAVLALVGGAAHLDIEIKGPGIERAVLDALAEYPATTWAISSFAWDTLRAVRRLDRDAEIWPLAERAGDDLIAVAAELASPAVSLFTGAYTAEAAEKLREAGLRVIVWTVNDPREARRVASLGAFALCTDDPQRISAAAGPTWGMLSSLVAPALLVTGITAIVLGVQVIFAGLLDLVQRGVVFHRSAGASTVSEADMTCDEPRKGRPCLRLPGGLTAMTVGGEWPGTGLNAVVFLFGVSSTLLGNTAIAALTEAEEIGRVAVPARRGRPDMAVANIGGSAIHFLTLNAGILAVGLPLPLDEATMRLHLPVAVVAPTRYCPILALRGGPGRRQGVLLAAPYVAYSAAAVRGELGMMG